MIDTVQWRVSIGLWNCFQSAAGPTCRGNHSIKTDSPNGKKKTRSLVLSLIMVLLFALTLISGYLDNPPLRGMNLLACSKGCGCSVTLYSAIAKLILELSRAWPLL